MIIFCASVYNRKQSSQSYVQSVWVRKLTGKPAFLTIADSESEVRRIQTVYGPDLSISAASNRDFRNLTGHPKAKRAYAWAHKDGPADSQDRYVAVLEIPPVESAVTAVRAAIVAERKRTQSN